MENFNPSFRTHNPSLFYTQLNATKAADVCVSCALCGIFERKKIGLYVEIVVKESKGLI